MEVFRKIASWLCGSPSGREERRHYAGGRVSWEGIPAAKDLQRKPAGGTEGDGGEGEGGWKKIPRLQDETKL